MREQNTPRLEAGRQSSLIQDGMLRKVVENSLHQDAPLNRMVEAFHKLYGLPIIKPADAKENLKHISKERLAMRFNLIVEEFMELCEAMDIRADINFFFQDEEENYQAAGGKVLTAEDHDVLSAVDHSGIVRKRCQDAIEQTEERNLPEIADACFDLKYVIIGFELETGIDPQFCAVEGHAANMTKLDADGSVIRRGDGKVMKGPNFIKPDMRRPLRALGMRNV